jgi:hypothetical protein
MERRIKRIFIAAMIIALAYQTYQLHRLREMAEKCSIQK